MTSLEYVLWLQKTRSVLQAPTEPRPRPAMGVHGESTTPDTVPFALQNNTQSSDIFAYVTGLYIGPDSSRVVMLQQDGETPYYPANPAADLERLEVDCAIPLGGPGTTRTVTVPRIAGGRVWFVQGGRLTFLLNRGPGDNAALVEPSVVNPTDPNHNLSWSFCEFTLNEVELFGNISAVDFFSHPIALSLESAGGGSQKVEGVAAGGLEAAAQELAQQSEKDGADWARLVIRSEGSGQLLRILSPNTGQQAVPGLFDGYYEPYVDQVWQKYSAEDLVVDTQAQWGVKRGRVAGDTLTFSDGVGGFSRPSTRDVFSCSTGAFEPQAGPNENVLLNIGARLAAAFNRATLLINPSQPDGEAPASYYRNTICNHYSRILHEFSVDGRGYAFPYDDVAPTGGADQAGTVSDGNPQLLTIVLGGSTASAAVGLADSGDRQPYEGTST